MKMIKKPMTIIMIIISLLFITSCKEEVAEKKVIINISEKNITDDMIKSYYIYNKYLWETENDDDYLELEKDGVSYSESLIKSSIDEYLIASEIQKSKYDDKIELAVENLDKRADYQYNYYIKHMKSMNEKPNELITVDSIKEYILYKSIYNNFIDEVVISKKLNEPEEMKKLIESDVLSTKLQIITLNDEKKAQDVYDKAISGEDFKTLVKENSIDLKSKKLNGYQVFESDNLPDMYKEFVSSSSIGDISRVILYKGTYNIVKVIELIKLNQDSFFSKESYIEYLVNINQTNIKDILTNVVNNRVNSILNNSSEKYKEIVDIIKNN